MVGRFFRKPAGDEPATELERRIAVHPEVLAGEGSPVPTAAPAPKTPAAASGMPDLVAERVNLHRFLLDKINLAVLDQMEAEQLHNELRPLVRDYVKAQNLPLNAKELDSLISDLGDEMLGLGPIEPLLKDDSISDILIVGPKTVYIERAGRLKRTDVRFKDEQHLLRIINKIVASVGRRVDESSPLVDARLADGSRVNAAIRPVAVDGPQVSIRKFSKRPFQLETLVQNGALPAGMAKLLAAAVEGKVSMIVSGGTGSGKTTMLNALSAFIPHEERLVTIEDAAELQLQQPHVVRLETRPPTMDGRNEILQRDLVKNALRMRPDRIIIGEVRGGEAFDMLQAMNTGHEGSMSTIHANNPRDALSRLEQMVGMAGMPMSQMSIRSQIASAIQVILQLSRMRDGTRRVTAISELTGMEGDVVQIQDIIKYHRTGVDEDGRVIGEFRSTGIRPRFLSEISTIGLKVDMSIFDPTTRH
ncbi:MAG: CpaF family protein [Paracoccaceae bacterium]|uniref:CpaF family protein n=1 Tax=unclassified Seohaeicola TaxID=2641111 RepID=UPI00237B3859|nr:MULTISPECIES: CpaF family protein [unclassified Seohaeicola]MDD9709362.1 CpaF family protein [Seohaeicola sp. 4SK31]MDD9737609.1 CpaF family protein [Seohaeicola sp. SP36]MDF1707204.1 CpaF family protein [Paracoccaceae bacterium]MDM7970287.1 CpaF family protein [Paracoccaceae bacterium]